MQVALRAIVTLENPTTFQLEDTFVNKWLDNVTLAFYVLTTHFLLLKILEEDRVEQSKVLGFQPNKVGPP